MPRLQRGGSGFANRSLPYIHYGVPAGKLWLCGCETPALFSYSPIDVEIAVKKSISNGLGGMR